jgi:hypothetical protein
MKIKKINRLPIIDINENQLFLLDQNNTDEDDLEIFIKASVNEYLSSEDDKQLNIGFIYNKTDTINLDKNKPIYKIITCINGDDNNILLVTEIDENKYTYKDFKSDESIHLIQFKQNTQVQLPDYCTIVMGNKCNYIHIYIYSNRPDATMYVSNNINNNTEKYSYTDETENRVIHVDNNINFSFLNELLYLGCNTFSFIDDIIKCNTSNHTNITLKSKYTDDNPRNMLNDINSIIETANKNNRFVNRHKLSGILDRDICEYILLYSKRYVDEISNRPSNNCVREYLDLTKIQDVKEIVLFYTHRKLLCMIGDMYNIPIDDYMINAKLITISTLYPDNIENKKLANPPCSLVIDVMLSHNDCKSHCFTDCTHTSLSIGDAIIYNNNVLKEFYNPTKEDIYLLSIFIDIVSMKHLIGDVY